MLHQFCPRLVVPTVTVLTPEYFAALGLEGALLDLDNTLVLWHGTDVEPAITDWLQQLRSAGMQFCLASNTHRPGRLAEVAAALDVPFELGVAKPGRRGLQRCLSRVGTPPEKTAMIGDQVFTDIWGGNRCGLYTILVRPMSPREFIGTRVVSRPLERIVISTLRRQGRLCEELPSEAKP
jgi:HAD superfamily phosphatase (TIGR01668 family)